MWTRVCGTLSGFQRDRRRRVLLNRRGRIRSARRGSYGERRLQLCHATGASSPTSGRISKNGCSSASVTTTSRDASWVLSGTGSPACPLPRLSGLSSVALAFQRGRYLTSRQPVSDSLNAKNYPLTKFFTTVHLSHSGHGLTYRSGVYPLLQEYIPRCEEDSRFGVVTGCHEQSTRTTGPHLLYSPFESNQSHSYLTQVSGASSALSLRPYRSLTSTK